jgi:hypothetical protein
MPKQFSTADKRELTLIIFRRTLPLMALSLHRQIEHLLQQLWLDDLNPWLTGLAGGNDSARVANEYVGRN